MSGSLVGALPFLGPAVGVWIAVVVGVMVFYFLTIARRYRSRDADDEPVGRRAAGTRTVAPPGPPQVRTGLPVYDMENYSHEEWGSPHDWTSRFSQP